jgi:hypothetical protein
MRAIAAASVKVAGRTMQFIFVDGFRGLVEAVFKDTIGQRRNDEGIFVAVGEPPRSARAKSPSRCNRATDI